MPKVKPAVTFASRLAALRHRAGLSQQVLADVAGVTRQHVYRMEAGRQLPSWPVACDLADALGCSVADFRVD